VRHGLYIIPWNNSSGTVSFMVQYCDNFIVIQSQGLIITIITVKLTLYLWFKHASVWTVSYL